MNASSKVFDDYITPFEAEHLIQSIKEIDIKEYGSKEYIKLIN